MIHARIDGVTTKNITGFECGNRALFDKRHGGDPLWVFLDYDVIEYRIDKDAFFLNPRQFYIDRYGLVQKTYVPVITVPTPQPASVYITDPDGDVLTDSDGSYLTENS